jgi:hypothetical protein
MRSDYLFRTEKNGKRDTEEKKNRRRKQVLPISPILGD